MKAAENEPFDEQSAQGRYRLVAELGRGGMAVVYLAVAMGPSSFRKLVVLKMLREQLSEDPDLVAMFLDEARLAARLNHINVVQTFEVTQLGDMPAIVMEYLEGQTLQQLMHEAQKRSIEIPLALKLRIQCEILAGLHHAHELSDYDGTPLELVHRDVSPHNVFLTFDGQVKVLDFGIAKAVGATIRTETGVMKGKTAYMAPEQFTGEGVDRRSDVFAAGVVLWELLAGRRMWPEKSDAEIMHSMFRAGLPSLAEIAPTLPKSLLDACAKALAPEKEERFATCAEFREVLQRVYRELDEPVEQDALAGLMTSLFSELRTGRRKIVEEQLAALKAVANDDDAFDSIREQQRQALPILSLLGGEGSNSPYRRRRIGRTGGATGRSKPRALVTPLRAGLALIGIALLGAVLYASVRSEADAAAGTTVPAAAARPPAAAHEPSPAPHASVSAAETSAPAVVTISAIPSEARLFLDGQPLASNPVVLRLPRAAGERVVHAEAAGYEPKSASLRVTGDTEIRMVLEKAASSVRRVTRRGAPAAASEAPAPPEAPRAREPGKPTRALDRDNPWE